MKKPVFKTKKEKEDYKIKTMPVEVMFKKFLKEILRDALENVGDGKNLSPFSRIKESVKHLDRKIKLGKKLKALSLLK